MKRILARFGMVLVLAAAVAISSQSMSGQSPAPESDASEKDVFKSLQFRNLGPAVGGGRVAAMAGIPGLASLLARSAQRDDGAPHHA